MRIGACKLFVKKFRVHYSSVQVFMGGAHVSK